MSEKQKTKTKTPTAGGSTAHDASNNNASNTSSNGVAKGTKANGATKADSKAAKTEARDRAKAEGPSSGGRAIVVNRVANKADPKSLLIVGLDTKNVTVPGLVDVRATQDVEQRLVDSIALYGVLEPVEVILHEDNLFVLNGRQRVRAARIVNAARAKNKQEPLLVDFVVRSHEGTGLNAETFQRGAVVTTNELSKKDGLLVKVAKLASFLSVQGASIELAAKTFGVSGQTIRNWQAVALCCDEVKKAIETGGIPVTAAMKIGRLKTKEEQLAVLAELMGAEEEQDEEQSDEPKKAAKAKKKTTAKKAAKAVAKKKQPHAAAKYDPPGKRDLALIAKHRECHPVVRATIYWILGEKSARGVPTVAEVMAAIAEE